MIVIVVGGGKTGSQLASQLLGGGHTVRVIDGRTSVIERLRKELPDECVLLGDGSSPSVLEEAEIEKANVLAAVTGEDDTNLVVAAIGRFEFSVPRIIARINNPKNAWLFTPEMGVDVALNQSDLMAKLIAEEMSLGDMMTLLKLRKGEYSIVEEKVDPDAFVVGKSVKEIPFPQACTLVAILRKGDLIVPHGDTVFQPVDEVLALVHASALQDLARLLDRPA
jgi:trk system potassium uptake protein TrkA